MIYPSLNNILRKSSKRKFKKDFIKYLSLLDFNEFENLFFRYSTIIAKLSLRYDKIKNGFLSKNWFKRQNLKHKYRVLYDLFYTANITFVLKAVQDLDIINSKKVELILKIKETQNYLEVITSNRLELEPDPKRDDIIKFILLVADSVYTSNKLIQLMDELDEINKK